MSHTVCGWLVTCPCLDLNVLGGWRHAEDIFHTFWQIELAWSVDVGVVLHRVSHSGRERGGGLVYGVLVL